MFSPIIIDGKAARQIPYGRLTKRPIIKDWPNAASSSPSQLAIWSLLYPGAVPGLLCDQWTVLDVNSLDWLHNHEHLLPPTYNYRTARGRHFYFERAPQLKSAIGKVAPKVDVKIGPAAVVFWPHFNGLRPVEAPLAVFPSWLLEKLPDRDGPRSFSQGPVASAPAPLSAPIVAWGQLHSTTEKGMGVEVQAGSDATVTPIPAPTDYEKNYAQKALGNAFLELRACQPGRRNELLNILAYKMGRLIARGWIELSRVEMMLEKACEQNGLIDDDGISSVRKTLLSGLSAGARVPYRDVAPPKCPAEATR